MKIIIFENEKSMVEGAFEAMNLAYFGNKISFLYYANSQDGSPFSTLADADIIFIDIQLTAKSELDGYNLLKSLLPIVGENRLAIITGYSKNDEMLEEFKLPKIPVIIKPVDYVELYNFIDKNFPLVIKKNATKKD